MAETQAYILYCESLREETGNKLSLIGVLGPDIVLESYVPTINLTVVALCRFFSNEPVDVEMSLHFQPAVENYGASSPKPVAIRVKPPENDGVWTSHIYGVFQGIPIHNGLVLRADFRAGDFRTSAPLSVKMPAPPASAQSTG